MKKTVYKIRVLITPGGTSFYSWVIKGKEIVMVGPSRKTRTEARKDAREMIKNAIKP